MFFNNTVFKLWPPLWSSDRSSWLHNGDVLCFLWGTNWVYICYVEESRPPLWSSGQRSWLRNRDVLCFLWGTNWIYICYVEESDPSRWPRGTLYPRKLAITSPTSGGRSVVIVHSRTHAKEFVSVFCFVVICNCTLFTNVILCGLCT
jgi:hypothetical protein